MDTGNTDWVGAGTLLTALILAIAAAVVQLRRKASDKAEDKAVAAFVLAQEERELVLSHRDAVQRLGGAMDRLGDNLERARQTMIDVIEGLDRHRSPPRK